MDHFMHLQLFDAILLLIISIIVLAGICYFLHNFREAPWYWIPWLSFVILLTGTWGIALCNAIIVGRGLPGNGWDGFGAAMVFFLTLPALVLDIIFLIHWPRKKSSKRFS